MEKKSKRINIYIDMKDKKKLDEIKYKYHLSYSTIVNIIVMEICKGHTDKWHLLNEQFIYPKPNNKKTSIKPKWENTNFFENYFKLTFLYTNCLKLFTNKELKKIELDDLEIQNITNRIYSAFSNTYEENWDGNRFQRMIPRIIKQNRNYYRRLLDNE